MEQLRIVVEGEKIISVGYSDYKPVDGRDIHNIDKWGGSRKDECKWVDGKVVKKTAKEVRDEIQIITDKKEYEERVTNKIREIALREL